MPSRELDLTSLRLFVQVCESGSLAAAGARSHIVTSGVSKRLAARSAQGETIVMPEGYVQRMHEAYSTFFHAYEAAPLLIVNTDHLDLVEGEEDFGLLLRCISEMRGQRSYFNKGA